MRTGSIKKPTTKHKTKKKVNTVRMSSAIKETRAAVTIQRWFKSLLSKQTYQSPNSTKSISFAPTLVPSTFEEIDKYLGIAANEINEMIQSVSKEVVDNSLGSSVEPEVVLANIRAKYTKLKSELQESQNTIELLKAQLENEKKRQEERKRNEVEIIDKQRADMEAALERQVNFIDQLVKDKSDLTNTCAQLKSKLVEEETKNAKKLKELEKKYKMELKRNKEAWAAAEKVRKEKWEKEKMKEIKTMTTKALEGEFLSMTRKHQQQLHDLEERLMSEFSKEKLSMANELRAKYEGESARVLEEAKIVFMKEQAESKASHFEELREIYEEQKKRIADEYNREIQRITQQKEQEREKYEKLIDNMKVEHSAKIDSMRLFFEAQIEALKN